ncbi:MAG: UDP-N-acetylmuramoyl-L-alanine--D-glutamate ligase [bacterium]|nr:UDP-N-acetylmuramoyl-L-alanine--D-glutamate ligase [bacterium]
MDCGDIFKNKRITVLGLGLLGRGVGDVEFLAKCGAQVLVTDKKSETELAESVAKLKQYKNVTFKLGGHDIQDFKNCDMVIKAAGVSLDSPEIAATREAGIPIAMSTALFAKYAMKAGAKVVGITGTRGKTTVAHMIAHVLKQVEREVHLGGNIRGVSTLAMLPAVGKDSIAVLELDSWQLQGFGDLKISPNISVFTNLMPDHQDYYKNMDEYFSDKANIFRYQHVSDVLIAGSTIADRVRVAQPPLDPIIPEKIPSAWTLKVIGEHNRENASLANAALQALGLSDDEIKTGLELFEGVEGRLQFVREVNGVKIYNDNNATTPEATIAALHALGEERKIVLIMGGADKELDMSVLIEEIGKRCKAVYLLAGTGTQRIQKYLPAPVLGSLEKAFGSALAAAVPGDVILFSPAFASFGMFKNEYERNDQFLTIVNRS